MVTTNMETSYRFSMLDAAFVVGSIVTFLADQTTGGRSQALNLPPRGNTSHTDGRAGTVEGTSGVSAAHAARGA